MLTREVYEGSQSDCILLATNGDKRWVSKCAHTFTYCTKRGKGNWLKETMPNKKPLYFKYHCIFIKGIVSQDWAELEMILLDRSEVINISATYFFFFFVAVFVQYF